MGQKDACATGKHVGRRSRAAGTTESPEKNHWKDGVERNTRPENRELNTWTKTTTNSKKDESESMRTLSSANFFLGCLFLTKLLLLHDIMF
mmetsp:Transcript_103052/g.210118  ORF Transcript_103052/g.210118 Transcript_103052/m.210118 type:complete len:91 (-) Transcript_103052:1498-1770(-)